MVSEEQEQRRSPQNQIDPSRGGIFSPRFKSVAALAGWDEEALLIASLVVEDTPDRASKHKHFDLNIKTPPTNSRRKRRAQRSPHPIPVTVLDLDDGETPRKNNVKKQKENRTSANEAGGNILIQQASASSSSSSGSALPCFDKLREELSCAICLEICFEPSSTPCGHSFCRKCLRSAADKCGRKCPKCRQLISNGRSCTVNTVLWNTIQLLFPNEVEARKAAGALNIREAQQRMSPETAFYNNLRNRSTRTIEAPSRGTRSWRRRVITTTQDEDEDAALARRLQREENGAVQNNNSRTQTPPSSSSSRGRSRRRITNQDEDAALALRLQREEFMRAFRGSQVHTDTSGSALSSARANLRAMASRVINLRNRDRRL